ncbi:MAG: hypothetical protein GWP36_00450 [Bacteroidetes bacterium]|nr:hypothetical protein [Bacteroidota bacterium]
MSTYFGAFGYFGTFDDGLGQKMCFENTNAPYNAALTRQPDGKQSWQAVMGGSHGRQS